MVFLGYKLFGWGDRELYSIFLIKRELSKLEITESTVNKKHLVPTKPHYRVSILNEMLVKTKPLKTKNPQITPEMVPPSYFVN